MKKLFIAMLLCAAPAGASWTGRFDTSIHVNPLALREIHDGQWLFGITDPSIWHVDYHSASGLSMWDGQRFHVGLFQAWNAEHGNASFGPLAGFDIPLPVSAAIGSVGEAIGLPNLFKPAQYFSSMISLDGFGGYRPVHTSDVNGPWVYGGAAQLKIAFGVSELQKGL